MPTFAQGGHLGFWFLNQQPLPPPPSKPILIVIDYGTTSGGIYPFGQYYTQERGVVPGGPDACAANIQRAATELGYKSTYTKLYGYNELKSINLTQYSQIWDISTAHPFNTDAQTAYTSYLQSGGKIYFAGENARPIFTTKNTSLQNYLRSLGAGGVAYDFLLNLYDPPNAAPIGTIASSYRLYNNISQHTYDAPGSFEYYGTGEPVITSLVGDSVAVTAAFWKKGTLSNAPLGTILAHLDISHISTVALNLDLIKNSILILNSK